MNVYCKRDLSNANICCTMRDVFVELYVHQPVQLQQSTL